MKINWNNRLNARFILFFLLHVVLILIALIVLIGFYQRQTKKELIRIKLKNEHIAILELQLKQKLLIDDIKKQKIVINGSDDDIKALNEKLSIIINYNDLFNHEFSNYVQKSDELKNLKVDLLELKSGSFLLYKYLAELGNLNEGLFFNLRVSEKELKRILSTGIDQTLYKKINALSLQIQLFNQTWNANLLSEIESDFSDIYSDSIIKNRKADDYKIVRLEDALRQYQGAFTQYGKKLMQIGIDSKTGINAIISNRYQHLFYLIKQYLEKNSKNNIFDLLLVYSIVLVLLVAGFMGIYRFYIGLKTSLENYKEEADNYFQVLLKGEMTPIPKSDVYKVFKELNILMLKFSEKLSDDATLLLHSIKHGKHLSFKKSEMIIPKAPTLFALYQEKDKLLKKVGEQNEANKWIRQGIEQFSEILRRDFEKPEIYVKQVLSKLLEYMNIGMGAAYLTDSENQNKTYKLIYQIAYGREKLRDSKIQLGEGLIGTAAAEKKMIILEDIPSGYFKLMSGFGNAEPKYILVNPIVINNEIYGILELASIRKFTQIELEFMQELSLTMGASLAVSEVYLNTRENLNALNADFEKLRSQKEHFEYEYKNLEEKYYQLKKEESLFLDLNKQYDKLILRAELDLDGNILDVNKKFEQLLKVPKEQLLNTNYRDYINSSKDISDVEMEKFWSNVRAGKVNKMEHSFIVDQVTLWLSETYVPFRDDEGRILKIQYLGKDITELKNSEIQLDKIKKDLTNCNGQISDKEKELVKYTEKIKQTQIKLQKSIDKTSVLEEQLIASKEQLENTFLQEQNKRESVLYEQISHLRKEIEQLKKKL